MSDGGAIVDEVPCVRDGREAVAEVIVSHDSVELGGWTFHRRELLDALAAGHAEVRCRHAGREITVAVDDAGGERPSIGDWRFAREDLLLALDA